MKRSYIKIVSAAAAAVLLLGSCSENGGTNGVPAALIDQIVADASQQSDGTSSAGAGNDAPQSAEPAAVDLDLTAMSSTMVYATVYNIVTEPQNYTGKKLRVTGYFDTSYNDALGVRYYFVVVPDATACCSQGLEFICDSMKNFPDDFPQPGKDIEVTGTIDSYDEEGYTYYYINTDSVKQL